MSKLHTYISLSDTIRYLHLLGFYISLWKNSISCITICITVSGSVCLLKFFPTLLLISNQTVQDDTQIFHCNFWYSFRSADLYKGIVTPLGLLFSNITEHKVMQKLKDSSFSCLVSLLEVNYVNNFIWSLSSWSH